jgi:hypothetical protein
MLLGLLCQKDCQFEFHFGAAGTAKMKQEIGPRPLRGSMMAASTTGLAIAAAGF